MTLSRRDEFIAEMLEIKHGIASDDVKEVMQFADRFLPDRVKITDEMRQRFYEHNPDSVTYSYSLDYIINGEVSNG